MSDEFIRYTLGVESYFLGKELTYRSKLNKLSIYICSLNRLAFNLWLPNNKLEIQVKGR